MGELNKYLLNNKWNYFDLEKGLEILCKRYITTFPSEKIKINSPSITSEYSRKNIPAYETYFESITIREDLRTRGYKKEEISEVLRELNQADLLRKDSQIPGEVIMKFNKSKKKKKKRVMCF